jgi:hypothetical protein
MNSTGGRGPQRSGGPPPRAGVPPPPRQPPRKYMNVHFDLKNWKISVFICIFLFLLSTTIDFSWNLVSPWYFPSHCYPSMYIPFLWHVSVFLLKIPPNDIPLCLVFLISLFSKHKFKAYSRLLFLWHVLTISLTRTYYSSDMYVLFLWHVRTISLTRTYYFSDMYLQLLKAWEGWGPSPDRKVIIRHIYV